MLEPREGYSFDWNGFTFFLKLAVFTLVVGNIGMIGFAHARTAVFKAAAKSEATVLQPKVVLGILSTSTSQRIIRNLTAADVIPAKGKFIFADLSVMKITLYENGSSTAEVPIASKGKPGTPWETPAGYYKVQTKERDHYSSIGHVHMPYSMQFYGNYFIHGWPHYDDGTPVSSSYSGGCIRLTTENAATVFEFADRGTNLFVYDPKPTSHTSAVALGKTPLPKISAESYLVADIDTGDVYLEKQAQTRQPIASVSKLVTALVANETISFDKKISVREGLILHKSNPTSTVPKKFLIGDLLYPLLMESNNGVAQSLADYYGSESFVGWMNATARSLDMRSTHFNEPSGLSPENISTTDDLFRLTAYISNKKSFIWKITRTPSKSLVATDGSSYPVPNFNKFFDRSDFIGGKIGYTDEADHTMVSLFSYKVGDAERRIAFIILQSDNSTSDTKALVEWYAKASKSAQTANAACATCTVQPIRKIDL